MVDEPNAEESENQFEQIVEEFLRRLRNDENPSTDELVKKYPQLAPALEKRLRIVESIFRSAGSDPTNLNDSELVAHLEKTDRGRSTIQALTVDAVARISCPHCGNMVQLVGIGGNEVTCGSCGSSVKIVNRSIPLSSRSELPKRLGRFILKRVLGEGAFGIVFLATDPTLDRDVAIKTPRSGYFATRDEEQRFFREAKHVACLRHPNIVQVHEISESESAPLIISEFIDGLTLNDLASRSLLSFKETARLMIQIANAVEFAHQKGVIHRDLKPSNILLDEDRNAYITDFGLARRDDIEITMTLEGAILGTPAYMAPEQAIGNQQLIGRRSDVYSLGVILYRLTTKDLPFHGTKRMLVHQVVHDEPKPPRSVNEFIPRDLETIILKAMSKSPDERYQTAGELADELQRFLMGEPIRARPRGSLVKFARWCTRHPAVAALSSTIAGLLVLCAAISILWAFNANRLRRVADDNALEANEKRRESSHRLHELLMNNGIRELERNNLTNSSLWFTQALAIEDTANDRTRLGMIQDRMPILTAVWATGSDLRSTAFSADGSRVVAASEKSICVYETQTKKKLFDEPVSGYRQFRLARDGAKFAICGQEKVAQLWSIDQRRLTARLPHDDQIESLDFDASSSKLVSGSFDSFVKVWNANDGSLIAKHSFEGAHVIRVSFIADTNQVIVVTNREGSKACELSIWDYGQDLVTAQGMMHGSYVVSVTVSADGINFCSGERDGTIKVWDIATGNQVGSSIITTNRLYDANFTGDETLVMGQFANGEIATFAFASGGRTQIIRRAESKFESMIQSPNRTILALAGSDGQAVFLWRDSGAQVCTPLNNGKNSISIAFHPDGRRVAIAGSTGVLQLWDLAGSCPSSFVLQHKGNVRNAIFASKTNRCLTTSLDGKGFIWDAVTGERIGDALEHEGGIYDCAVTLEGSLFATVGADNAVKIWDSLSGKQVGNSYPHDAKAWIVRFNHDGTRVLTGDESGTVRFWDVNANASAQSKPLFEFHHNARVMWLTLSSDGSTLASTALDGSIKLWDSATGLPKFPTLAHGNKAAFCDFLPGAKRLVSGGADNSIIVWELATGKIVQDLPSEGNTHSIQVLENGKRIAATNFHGRTRVWKADDAGVFSLENDFVHAALDDALFTAFNPRASILATCGGSRGLNLNEPQTGAIALWNLNDRRPLGPPLQHLAPVRRVYFSADGQRLLTASEDQTARLWKVNSTSLPISDLKQIAQLYAQYLHNSDGDLEIMDPQLQPSEFEGLLTKHPSYFVLDEADRKVWDYEVKQKLSNDQSFQ